MASGRSTGWLVALALAALMPSDATAAEPVVRDSHVEDVLALGGTFVYRRSGVPLRRSWMRVAEGRVQRAHGVPARGRASAIGRDRDKRVVVTMAVEGSGWWLYDVVADPRELDDVWAELGGERREWEAQLRSIAEIAAAGGLDLENVDEATQRNLKALGY